jgi:hypothetical protein
VTDRRSPTPIEAEVLRWPDVIELGATHTVTSQSPSAALGPSAVCEHRGVTEHGWLAAERGGEASDVELVASRPHRQAPRPGARLLVGRDQEISMVPAALDAAQVGSPTMTLIVGERVSARPGWPTRRR